jgi:hypothetical protein
MLIIRKDQTNNLIATVSMNKTLSNPYYLFSFQHITSKERVSFIPQVITSNVRYDKFRFVETATTNLNVTPPQVNFFYEGQYYYSIYEQISSGNTDPSLAYNKLESGRAIVIVGEDQQQLCFYEPYISQNEIFENVVYISELEQECQAPITPSVTPSNTPTPSVTASVTPTPSITPSATPSATPTLTPTPSTTPPSAITPNTYNALWWLDFTDQSSLSLTGTSLYGAKNLSTSIGGYFSANTASPLTWSATSYNGVSGATYPSNSGLSNQLGMFMGNYSAYTHFVHLKTITDNANGNITQSDNDTNWSGQTQGYRWFSLSDYIAGSPPNFLRAYTFDTLGNSWTEPTFNTSADTWYKVAVRVYQNGSTAVNEIWVDGILVSSGTTTATIRTSTDPIFAIMQSGTDYVSTEHFFIPSKLSDPAMGVMFNYLNNKY